MKSVVLRKATPEDCAFAYHVRKSAFKEYVEQVWDWDEEAQRRVHEERFAKEDFRVISAGGEDVGVMALAVEPDCLRVHQLYVLPEHQGKGFGRECMLLAMDEARRLRRPARLRVMKVNPRARAFYERLGFACVGETDTHDLMEWNPKK